MSDDNTNKREAHQLMLEGHKQARALRRERHSKRWHKFKILPITLI